MGGVMIPAGGDMHYSVTSHSVVVRGGGFMLKVRDAAPFDASLVSDSRGR